MQDPSRVPDRPADIAAIIGIGVTAASLSSLNGILSAIEPGLGGTYLVMMGGEDVPEPAEMLAEIAAATALKVVAARDGETLQPEHASSLDCRFEVVLVSSKWHFTVLPHA